MNIEQLADEIRSNHIQARRLETVRSRAAQLSAKSYAEQLAVVVTQLRCRSYLPPRGWYR